MSDDVTRSDEELAEIAEAIRKTNEERKKIRAELFRVHGRMYRPTRDFWVNLSFNVVFPWSIAQSLVAVLLAFYAKNWGLDLASSLMLLLVIGASGFVILLTATHLYAKKKIRRIDDEFWKLYSE